MSSDDSMLTATLTREQQQEMAKKERQQQIKGIVLDISLASSLPANQKRDLVKAASATNALACLAADMNPRELRELEYTIGSLIILLLTDVDSPICAKSAFSIRMLIGSHVNMSRFVEEKGLNAVGKTMDILLGSNSVDFKTKNMHRSIVEHISIIYREVSRFYPWKTVKVGCLRHCVILLRFGDVELQTIASSTLATLSPELEICKQMFTNGAIKPLLNVADGDISNEACMLAAMGCLVQLCRVPEIAIRIVQQGAVPIMEKALNKKTGFGIKAIREKALYSLAWLTRVDEVRPMLVTKLIMKGMRRELRTGTFPARYTIVQMLLNLHGRYTAEPEFIKTLKDIIFDLMCLGPWNARNLCLKAICVLYGKDNDMKMYFVEKGLVDQIYRLIDSKGMDLQEAPLATILALCAHPHIPRILLLKYKCADVIAKFFACKDDVIRECAVVIMKAFYLYEAAMVKDAIPKTLLNLMDTGDDMPKLYGSEYGDMIQEYLQKIVENRRDMLYLLETVKQEEMTQLGVTENELASYQNTFIELDFDCQGKLGEIELKMLMVLMGEEMDVEEIKDLLTEFDKEKKGYLNFSEFVKMMKGWSTRFGSGASKIWNEATKRGALGKASRMFNNWLNEDEEIAKQVAAAKAKRKQGNAEVAALYLQTNQAEQMRVAREQEMARRAQNGVGYKPNQKAEINIDDVLEDS